MNNVIKTAGVVVLNNNEVLLVKHLAKAKHITNTYGLPGGKIEKNDIPIATAQKELFEETGLKTKFESLIKIPKIYTAYLPRKDGLKSFSLEAFLCIQWTGKIHQNEEKTIPEWIPISSLDKIQLIGDTLEIINDAIKFYRKF